MKRKHVSTWRMIFKYFDGVLHNYIKHNHNCNHLLFSFKLHVMIKENIGQFCGLVEFIVGDWIW